VRISHIFFLLLPFIVVPVVDNTRAAAQSGYPATVQVAKGDYAALSKVPEKARAKSNPLENDPGAVAAGEKLFQEHCAECHGTSADGGKKGVSLRSEEVKQATPGALFWILTNGVVRQGMPVWSKLPEPQRWQIVTFLRSLATPVASQPGAASNTAPGEAPR
jgi:mono/diheme cytochrome c family protein